LPMSMSKDVWDNVRSLVGATQKKLDRLRSVEPYLIDLSLRENVFGARVGQTLQDKLAILPKLRDFGFKNILLGTLDYAMPEELEVDDDFMMYLRDHAIDTTGGFAFTDIGLVDPRGTFRPSASQEKLAAYRVPNTLHEIYLSKEGMGKQYDLATLKKSLPVSIKRLLEHVRGDGGGKPRILINIVDGCDAFAENLEATCEILQLLAEQPIEGVSFEDDRGTYLPFQVGAFVAIARQFLPPPLKLLVHMHSGGGFENASLIEALVNGADGVWGGLPKRAAIIGHASLGELIANLIRTGNTHVQTAYKVGELLPLATSLQVLDEKSPVPDDLPILGTNAYRLTLDFFEQKRSRFMDLPPELIGGRYGYRICPVAADQNVVRGRLAEVTGRPAKSFPEDVLTKMVQLMRRELRKGERIVYDDPPELMKLYARAGGCP
ncbi:MAG: hypothetical protein ABW133_20555, partial [Polyangiaceae bacterium]